MRRAVAVAAAVVAALALFLAAPAPAAADDAAAEADFVARINGERTARGLGALRVDAELTAVARRWSGRMAADNRLSHNPNLADEVTQDWEKLGENVGVGGSVAAIHDAFMNSTAHRANVLDRDFTHVGVGVVTTGDGRIWVTEVFMRLRAGASSPPPPPPPPPPTTTTVRPAPPPTTAPLPPRSTTTVPPPPPTSTTVAAPQGPKDPLEARGGGSGGDAPSLEPPARLVFVLDALAAFDRGR